MAHLSGKPEEVNALANMLGGECVPRLVGQFVANAGADTLDNADVNGLVTKFTNALTTNLSLGTASKRNDGTGVNQIPDMSSFTGDFSQAGYASVPGGLIIQWGG